MKEAPVLIKYIRPLLGITYILLTIGLIYVITFMEVKPGSSQILYLAIGILLGGAQTVLNYYFGTSKDKSDQEQKSMSIQTDIPPVDDKLKT